MASSATVTVLVGSGNPVKVRAARRAAELVYAPRRVECRPVPEARSGVPAQPRGDDETLLGAENRVRDVLASIRPSGAGDKDEDVDRTSSSVVAVAVEGGVVDRALGRTACMAWVVAAERTADGGVTTARARSAEFELPQGLADLVAAGMELGDADDAYFGRVASGSGQGTVGKLTRGLVSREDYYVQPFVLALSGLSPPPPAGP